VPNIGGTGRSPMSEEEFEAFYRRIFLPLVRRLAWKFGLSKEDASDLVQDAFIVAITKIDAARNPKAWLTQVVDHLAVNYRRKAFRRAQLGARFSMGPSSSEEDCAENSEVSD
jgi:DNA-directed RNA polymerase specialized sigma24 family protein